MPRRATPPADPLLAAKLAEALEALDLVGRVLVNNDHTYRQLMLAVSLASKVLRENGRAVDWDAKWRDLIEPPPPSPFLAPKRRR